MTSHRPGIRRLFVVATVALLSMVLPPAADACMCGGSTCGSLKAETTIFEATVVGLDKPPADQPYGETVVRLQDVRMLRGQAPARLVLDRSGCGYEFTIGVRYVIEADSSGIGLGREPAAPGVVSASTCGATRPSAKAAGLRTWLLGPPEARPRVWGTVTAETSSGGHDVIRGGGPPVAGAVVALRGPVQRTSATRSTGEFQFVDVPDGHYTVSLELPGSRGDVREPEHRDFELGPESPCVPLDLVAWFTARVIGRLLDPQGRPVSDVQIELYSPGFNVFDRDFVQRPGGSDATGHFEIEQVPPGRYVVGIGVPRPDEDMPFAPAQGVVKGSATFTVGPGATVDLPPIVARRLPFVHAPGRFEDPSGGAVGDVAIVAMALDAPEAGRWRLADTDADGRFTVGVLRGVRYRFEARRGERVVARVETVVGDEPIRLVASPR